MIRRVVVWIYLFTLVLAIPFSAAQENPQGWETVKRCVGELPYPSIPQNKWTFEGTIFSQNSEGVRGIRSDLATSYFVALKSSSSFTLSGAFSPDGHWFAYPVGYTDFGDLNQDDIFIQGIKVVSADPSQKSHKVNWQDFNFGEITIPHILWLDNESLIYGGDFHTIVKPFSGEVVTQENVLSGNYFSFSPNLTRALYWDDGRIYLANLDDGTLVSFVPKDNRYNDYLTTPWLPNSSGFIGAITQQDTAANRSTTMLALFDGDGKIVETIASIEFLVQGIALSVDGNKLAYTTNGLFIADLNNRQVIDFCLGLPGNNANIAWSPDNVHLVFTIGGYPIILNAETLDMQILRYETGEILGWYDVK